MSAPLYVCQNCDWRGPEEALVAEIHDLEQRVGVGEPMPAGECPECGALCHEDEAPPRYTAEPGRNIYRDGKPFIYIGRLAGAAEADMACKAIVRLPNGAQEDPCGPEAFRRYLEG